jgi:phosphate transport system protein
VDKEIETLRGHQKAILKLLQTKVVLRRAQKMTKDVIDSFIKEDPNLAKSVILLDKDADNLRNLVQGELVEEYMSRDCTTAGRAIPLLLVARHLERICDHATNIAENVIYMVKAKVVKHHVEKLRNGN